MRVLLAFVLLWSGCAIADEVYRHVGLDGVVRYTDKPPDPHARPIQLEPLSGPVTAAKPRKRFYSPAALRAAARFAVSVESPTPGQVLRAGTRMVAAASVMPGLVEGFSLRYLLDGRSVTPAPTDELSILLPDLAPGEYRLRIAVLDPRGQELARSEETVFRVDAP
ncbi:DUF4124 domain-containing protein [Sinimarinibacterium thermocellulolyticum]|uniref:DUF4124 domain-containing protein n=1 Tax=Sinimarinibacterium thermocellulolyticum TaxID=3170016 RepID=A0ABV2ABV9_9GAMM